nr:MAG TPA: hypothetical protein [Caudoviricetes sp.]
MGPTEAARQVNTSFCSWKGFPPCLPLKRWAGEALSRGGTSN